MKSTVHKPWVHNTLGMLREGSTFNGDLLEMGSQLRRRYDVISPQQETNWKSNWNTERTPKIFPGPILVYTPWQNDDSGLNMP